MNAKKTSVDLQDLTGLDHWPLSAEEESQQVKERETALAEARQVPQVLELVQALEHRYEVAKLLRSVRKRACLTQAVVAARLGTRQAQVTRIESGAQNVSIGTVFRFAAACGAEIDLRVRFPHPIS